MTTPPVMTPIAPPAPVERKAKLVRLSSLKPRPIQWLMPGRVPFGAMTLLAGRPGEGKSQFAIRLAADLTQRDVPSIFIGDEDGAADTVLPRVLGAGGNSELVSMFDMERDDMAQLPTDVPLLKEIARETGAALVVIDPIQAHLDEEINPNADASLRRATRPLGRMAQELGIAVLMITHLRKSTDGGVLDRVGGSGGLVGACRSVLYFGHGKNPSPWEADVRYICHVKANGAEKAPALQCRIQGESVQVDDMVIPTSQLLFEEETTEIGPRDLE